MVIFSNDYYRQVDGVAFDSNKDLHYHALLCIYEKQWLSGCSQDNRPIIYKVVDDIFVNVESRDQTEKFVKCMNNKHHHIKLLLSVIRVTLPHFMRSRYTARTISSIFIYILWHFN